MEVGLWREAMVMVGGAIAAAIALARLSFSLHRTLVERFMEFVEKSLERQEATHEKLCGSVDSLTRGISENTGIVRRLAEKLAVTFGSDAGLNSGVKIRTKVRATKTPPLAPPLSRQAWTREGNP